MSNPTVRRVRRLRKRAWRERRSHVLLEGHRTVGVALGAEIRLPELLHTERARRLRPELLVQAKSAGARVYEVSDEVMAHLTSVATAPDILAVGPLTETALDTLTGGSAVVLEGIHDPAAAGGLIATAVAAGIQAVVVGSGCADPFSPKVIRAAQGAHYLARMVRVRDAPAAAEALAVSGPRLVGLAPDGPAPWEESLAGPMVLMVTEDPATLPEKATRVAVPSGRALPPLTARAAVVLYEWRRQRGHDG